MRSRSLDGAQSHHLDHHSLDLLDDGQSPPHLNPYSSTRLSARESAMFAFWSKAGSPPVPKRLANRPRTDVRLTPQGNRRRNQRFRRSRIVRSGLKLCVNPLSRRRRLHIVQRTYGISTGTGFFELSVMLFSPEIFTSYATSEIATPSEHDAITCIFGPSSCSDLTVHF